MQQNNNTQSHAAAAAAAAQQQHFNRMAATSNGASALGTDAQGGASVPDQVSPSAEERKVLEWVAQLLYVDTREAALLELSKKREQFPQLALILWHSFGKSFEHSVGNTGGDDSRVHIANCNSSGVMAALLEEIISVYPLLIPSQLTAAASNRICNALALLQCVASHVETRSLFLNGM